MMRLRSGKWYGRAGVPGGYSLSTTPVAATSTASSACSAGYTSPTSPPSTAAVRPVLSAPRCAAESTPRASPLTTVMPRAATSAASRRAASSAAVEAARAPTIATPGAARHSSRPRYQSSGGMSESVRRCAGNAGSFHATVWIPRRAAAVADVARLRQQRPGQLDRGSDRRPAAARRGRLAAGSEAATGRRRRSWVIGVLQAGARSPAVKAPDPLSILGDALPASQRETGDNISKARPVSPGSAEREIARFTKDLPWHMAC